MAGSNTALLPRQVRVAPVQRTGERYSPAQVEPRRPPKAPPTTQLSGALDGLGLPQVVRFLSGLRKTGWLRVEHGSWRGELFLDNGQVVAAACGSLRGLSAIDALVHVLPELRFTFTSEGE